MNANRTLLLNALSKVHGIDVYLTYRCDMRCSHCFVGPRLGQRNLPYPHLGNLLEACAQTGVHEVTYLGGEPTLYPRIDDALRDAWARGLEVRIVSNGMGGLSRLLDRLDPLDGPLHICLSLDGDRDAHDSIRRPGAYEAIQRVAERCHQMGIPLSGITSVSRDNVEQVESIVRDSDRLGFTHLNLHYVSARGFATAETVLSAQEWDEVRRRVTLLTAEVRLPIRFEDTFVPAGRDVRCVVKHESNLMFFPDGKVFHCALFIDVPDGHSFEFTGEDLERASAPTSERCVVQSGAKAGCPVASRVYDDDVIAGIPDLCCNCIYDKTVLKDGLRQADFRGH